MQTNKIENKLRLDIFELCSFLNINPDNFLKDPYFINEIKRNVIFHILIYKYNYHVKLVASFLEISENIVYYFSKNKVDMNLVEYFEKVSLKDILTKEMLFEKLCELYDLEKTDVIPTRSTYETTLKRHIIVYILSFHFNILYKQIALMMGYKGLSISIRNILNTIDNKLATNYDFKILYKKYLDSDLNGVKINYGKLLRPNKNGKS